MTYLCAFSLVVASEASRLFSKSSFSVSVSVLCLGIHMSPFMTPLGGAWEVNNSLCSFSKLTRGYVWANMRSCESQYNPPNRNEYILKRYFNCLIIKAMDPRNLAQAFLLPAWATKLGGSNIKCHKGADYKYLGSEIQWELLGKERWSYRLNFPVTKPPVERLFEPGWHIRTSVTMDSGNFVCPKLNCLGLF